MNTYIWGCGYNSQHGLGDEINIGHLEPNLLPDPITGDKLEWIQIECGGSRTLGLTKNGDVFSWGSVPRESGPTKVEGLAGRVITKIACGLFHDAALTDKGELLTWGSGYYGQLGHDTISERTLVPQKVEALADEVIVDVACQWRQTCAVTSTGSILTWGKGIATGHGEQLVMLPRLLEDLSSKHIVSVSTNKYHTACVTKDGELFTWGGGKYGMLGHRDENDQRNPKRVEALVGTKVTMVSCGWYHTAVCTEDGHMYTFGWGGYGQLGHRDEVSTSSLLVQDVEKEYSSSPALVPALKGKHITQVQCGLLHTMALTSSGYVFTWGDARSGVLGHGDVQLEFLSYPCLVEGLREYNVVQISTGSEHCAVLVDSTSPSSSRQALQASLNNQEHSDVVLMVENQPLYASIEVLTRNSDYFAAMFRSNMRESIERVVQVPNFSKAAFLLVLEYIHLDGFTVSMDDVVELLELADFYQMEGLKYSCMSTLERGLYDENVSEILEEVEDLGCSCDGLKRKKREYAGENFDVTTLLGKYPKDFYKEDEKKMSPKELLVRLRIKRTRKEDELKRLCHDYLL